MVKKLIIIISVCMMGMGMLAGCGAKDSSDVENSNAQKKEEPINEGYVFESNGVEITVDMDMSTIEEELGEPSAYFEQPSCAAQGIAKIYTYSGYQIETYPDGDKDLIACIILKDDSVSTPEGIDLSMSKDNVIEVYGSDYEESDHSMVYEKNGTKLCFIMDGDDITSIEYNSPVLN